LPLKFLEIIAGQTKGDDRRTGANRGGSSSAEYELHLTDGLPRQHLTDGHDAPGHVGHHIQRAGFHQKEFLTEFARSDQHLSSGKSDFRET
jgi:hypothetical protein